MSAPIRRPRLGCLVLSGLGGVFGGVVSIVLVAAIAGRDPSPELTTTDFEAAQERWQSNGPASYDLEVKVVGPQPAIYRVEVRQGEVISAMINGRPLKQRRTFDTWSVPGMFDTIERDVANVELVASGQARKETPRLTLRADFDAALGYPCRYRRIEWGTNRDMIWKVQKFEPR